MIHGEVKTWKMTEEERLAYIEKHPIRPVKGHKRIDEAFSDIHSYGERRKKDYKWRSEKAAAASPHSGPKKKED